MFILCILPYIIVIYAINYLFSYHNVIMCLAIEDKRAMFNPMVDCSLGVPPKTPGALTSLAHQD